jgi:hypothetical protein
MLCRDIVSGALRKAGVLASGREPRPSDQTDTFAALVGLYRVWITSGTFGRLRDVIPTGSSYTAGENEHVFRNDPVTLTVDLPETVRSLPTWIHVPYDREVEVYPDSDVLNGVRPPRHCAVVIITDTYTGTTAEFIYDGQIKQWVGLYELTLDSEAPLSHGDPEGLKAALALAVADEFGGQIGQITAGQAALFRSNLGGRWSQPSRVVQGVYC